MFYLKVLCTLLPLFCYTEAQAYIGPSKESSPNNNQSKSNITTRGGACNPSSSDAELSINNVRARLLGGGDMWWDLTNSRYEVPKVVDGSGEDPVSALFAGSVWIGGYDPAGQLKIAAIDYRDGNTNEWWPGPIDEATGTTCEQDCNNWDRHFEVLGDDIRQHIADYNRSLNDLDFEYTIEDIPESILYWPARGNVHFAEKYGFELPNSRQGLGDFSEPPISDNDLYEPELGEYPQIDIRGCEDGIFADQMFFWLYNDVGNIHSNTQGDPIQMEVQVQSFAFQTTDEINDMTFYRYKLINRAQQQIDSCFFGMWVDPDLGCYADDYVGCDIERSLMYVYNADEVDGLPGSCDCDGVASYCDDVPMLGIDYFRGPTIPKIFDEVTGELRDLRDNEIFFDTLVEGGMSSFVYYNNPNVGSPPPSQSDPVGGPAFYNYLSGSWADGTPLTSGGTGYNPGSTEFTKYAFNDPPNVSGAWSMCEEGLNPEGDRRTLQATGPLRLLPGALNELIIGVVWVPGQGYPCPDLSELFGADQKAQDLFDECFKIPRGPDAPNVDIIELDRELIIVLTNEPGPLRNNENETYRELGLGIPDEAEDQEYVFEGYRIFQVVNPNVTRQELNDETKAREIATFDVENGVTKIFNWESMSDPFNEGQRIYFPEQKVDGRDDGIKHTIRIKDDRFSTTSDKRLVNHKDYYFYALAYGYNNYEVFDVKRPRSTQDEAYLEGRLNVGDMNNENGPYAGTPRPMIYQELNAQYGQGAGVTRLDGIGAGGSYLRITEDTEESILDGTFGGEIKYQVGGGPIDIRVFNPLEITSGEYVIEFIDENPGNQKLDDSVTWKLYNAKGDTIRGDKMLGPVNEQIVKEFGFSINIGQSTDAGVSRDNKNGFIGWSIDYTDPTKPFWLGTISDGLTVSGTANGQSGAFTFDFIKNGAGGRSADLDPFNVYGSNGIFPWTLTSHDIPLETISPSMDNSRMGTVKIFQRLQDLNNVDIVMTPDKNKWSRCIVVEAANALALDRGVQGIGGASDFDLRRSPSVGKDDLDNNGCADPDGTGDGMSWFPGYAIDVETGKRLNIFFSENSAYNENLVEQSGATFLDDKLNATDMMFNPSSQMVIEELLTGPLPWATYAGGQHFIYVMDTEYDECESLKNVLQSGGSSTIARALARITWCMIPITLPDARLLSMDEGLIPNEVRISARVDNPYQWSEGTDQNKGYNMYKFSFDGVEPKDLESKKEREEVMSEIRAVPNPYYGFSEYEVSQFDNFIKLTNLPFKATVTIFSLEGNFIREFKRDVSGQKTTDRINPGIDRTLPKPDLIWDLKNSRNIPIASGTYLIHVVDEETGAEKTLKWFGAARKFNTSGL